MLLYTLLAQKARLEPNWIGKENQPKLELDERDAGDKTKGERGCLMTEPTITCPNCRSDRGCQGQRLGRWFDLGMGLT